MKAYVEIWLGAVLAIAFIYLFMLVLLAAFGN